MRLGIWVLAAALLLPVAATAETSCADPLAAAARLSAEPVDLDQLHIFYRAEDPCLWSDAATAALTTAIAALDQDGLDPNQFHAAALALRATPADPDAAAERDLIASDAALAYAHAMVEGRVDPARLSDQIDFPHPVFDPAPGLRAALGQGNVALWLGQLMPADPEYAALKQVLARYRGLASWPVLPLPGRGSMAPGDHDPLIVLLKERLHDEGLLADVDAGDVLAGPVLDALKHFQVAHGLTADGKLGKQSFAILNVTRDERIGQTIANLERRRELSHLLPPTRLEVNVAAAALSVLRDGQVAAAMRTVVGDPEHQTPMVVSSIRDVEINPPWIVPTSIIVKEIRPKLKRDPGYLARNEMVWDNGQLIQAPGPKNSLGRLKFEFPNPFSIYLHDTPQHNLFALDARALSHGCVRLEHPLDLAQLLLADPTPDPITQAIATGRTSHVRLPTAMPVAVLYWTVFVDSDGTTQFRDDVYERDARLLTALQGPRRRSVAPGGTF